ncbi:MAG: glutamate mutase L [Armatimonadetes bacterium]|nr:glutamate mutase L [Armatimonadota bacterium]
MFSPAAGLPAARAPLGGPEESGAADPGHRAKRGWASLKIRSILATDCGSTTTKCILIEETDEGFRLKVRGEAPTTVEAPAEDVTLGVANAVAEVQELAGRQILDEHRQIIKPYDGTRGVDVYLSTSSAGGGLQMVVGGVVKEMTAESAQRAALGAGAIVMDVLACNDGRLPHERIERIRQLRPDMVLLAGGVEGGTVKHVVELAQIVAAADPRPRLGITYQLPVIYAGNGAAADNVRELLAEKTALEVVDNLRPSMEQENLQPARLKIQEQFLEHVMAHAPGYPNLMKWTDEEIMPTPAAVGSIMQRVAEKYGISVVGVDIGGATTDVFSVFQQIFNRTVSANYGMSYSYSNVFADAGLDNVMRWVPFALDERELRNRIKNKMIRPTSIPYLLEELVVEQAMAREALRLSFDQHKLLATGLKGVQKVRDISTMFLQGSDADSLVNLLELDMLIGSGGVLSHAPRRSQAALMMIDAFLPEGVTRLTVDSIFMMPQLGVLAEVHPEAATQVFEKDCLVVLGTCIAPVGPSRGPLLLKGRIGDQAFELRQGEIRLLPLGVGETAAAVLEPQGKLDVGAGRGKVLEREVHGGVVGVILDGRGRRPFRLPDSAAQRRESLRSWIRALDLYSEEALP